MVVVVAAACGALPFVGVAVGRGRPGRGRGELGRWRPELRRFSPRRCGHGGLHAERAHARRGRRRSRGKQPPGGSCGGGDGEQAAAPARLLAGCEGPGPARAVLRRRGRPWRRRRYGRLLARAGVGGKRLFHFRIENVLLLRRPS